MTVTVRENPAESRFEIFEDDQLAGFAAYELHDGQIDLLHTEIASAFGGRGMAGQLVRAVLDEARERGLAVLPTCPYVRRFITKNDEYVDLVPAEQRQAFGLDASAEKS